MDDSAEPSGQGRHRTSAKRGRSYKAYTDEDRARAVALLLANANNLRGTARQLGIPATTLRTWAAGGVRPADPRRVLEVGAALDAKLEACLDWLLAFDPADFPRTSILDHVEGIALLVDRIMALRGGCRPVAEQLAAASTPLDRAG